MNHLLWYKNSINIWKIFSFIVLLVIAFVLRVWDLPNATHFEHDHARDTLVAKYISEHGNPQHKLAPFAGGFLNQLKNPSSYYDFLAIIWKIKPSVFALMLTFVCLGVITCINVFLIGYFSKDYQAGIMAMGLCVFSNWLIKMSRVIWQPFMLPSLISLTTVFYVAYQRYKKLWLLFVAQQVVWVGLHFHYAIIPFLVCSSYLQIYQILELKPIKKVIVGLLLTFLIHIGNYLVLLSWTPTYLSSDRSWPINYWLSKIQPVRVFDAFNILASSAFYYPVILGLIIIITFMISIYQRKRLKRMKLNLGLWWLCVASVIIIGLAPTEVIGDSYLPPYLVLVYPLLGILLTQISNHWKWILWLIILPFGFTNPLFNNYDRTGSIQYYTVRKMAEIIANHPLSQSSFQILWVRNKATNWFGPGIWYFLEEIKSKPLVDIVADANNIKPMTDKAKVTFYICENKWVEVCVPKLPSNAEIVDRIESVPNSILVVRNGEVNE